MKSALIVEDLAQTRAWLHGMVRSAFPQIEVSGAASVGEARAAIGTCRFDLALIDLKLPDGSGMEVLQTLRERNPEALCVITTIFDNDEHLLPALAAGAMGYLLKEQPEDVQVRQLRQLADGVPALSPPIARRMLSHFREVAPRVPPTAGLTARETEVLGHIARGLRVSEAARLMGLTDNTVAGYVKAIYQKLGISSRAEAAVQATRLGLLK